MLTPSLRSPVCFDSLAIGNPSFAMPTNPTPTSPEVEGPKGPCLLILQIALGFTTNLCDSLMRELTSGLGGVGLRGLGPVNTALNFGNSKWAVLEGFGLPPLMPSTIVTTNLPLPHLREWRWSCDIDHPHTSLPLSIYLEHSNISQIDILLIIQLVFYCFPIFDQFCFLSTKVPNEGIRYPLPPNWSPKLGKW